MANSRPLPGGLLVAGGDEGHLVDEFRVGGADDVHAVGLKLGVLGHRSLVALANAYRSIEYRPVGGPVDARLATAFRRIT